MIPNTKDPIPHPSTLVIFGATGDLFKKKIVPAIHLLKSAGRLPEKFDVVGFGRRDLTDETFRALVAEALSKSGLSVTDANAKELSFLFSYVRGEFEDTAAFIRLKERVDAIDATRGACSAKAFYFAVPPEFFDSLFRKLGEARLNEGCGEGLPSARILVEKPFGRNLEQAKALNTLLRTYFDESNIHRVEHYLAKDVLRVLPRLRKEHTELEQLLSLQSVKEAQVRLYETVGAEDRGPFYDAVGAWRDVGENHCVEMLALTLMELPHDDSAAALREARGAFIASLPELSDDDVRRSAVRAQYEGYRTIQGVAPESSSETFFKLSFTHRGVPITLESGKRLPRAEKGVTVNTHSGAMVHIDLEPDMRVAIEHPDGRMEELWRSSAEKTIRYAAQYADLIADALLENHAPFVSAEEVEAEWCFADPITNAFARNVVPLGTYAPDSEIPV